MKRIKTSVLLTIGSIFAAISFSACSDDFDSTEQASIPSSSSYPVSDVHVMASGYVRTISNTKALGHSNINELKPEDFIITPVSEAEVKGLNTGEAGDDGSVIGVYKWVTLLYRCKTADGTLKDLSELIVWPYGVFKEATPSQLVIGCHSTITSDEQRPTNFSNMSSLGEINMLALFSGDEVVPYCNLESVRNTWGVDGIKLLSFESYFQLHVATGTLFFTWYCGSLVDEILNDKWTPSEQVVG